MTVGEWCFDVRATWSMGDWDFFELLISTVTWFNVLHGGPLDCNSLVWNSLELDFNFYIEISM